MRAYRCAWALCVASVIATVAASDLDRSEIAALHSAIRDRTRRLGDVEFEYEVVAGPVAEGDWDLLPEDVAPDGRVRSRDRLTLRTGREGAGPTWRAWRRFVHNREHQVRLDRLMLWDGNSSTSLIRGLQREGSRDLAKIVAWEDREQYADNWFDKILHLNLHALPPYCWLAINLVAVLSVVGVYFLWRRLR